MYENRFHLNNEHETNWRKKVPIVQAVTSIGRVL